MPCRACRPGAGHDGQAVARLCPIAMLFVRCRGGISHNPAEFASVEDMGTGRRGADPLRRKFQTLRGDAVQVVGVRALDL